MKTRYRVELQQTQSACITVEADDEQHAEVLTAIGIGGFGDTCPPEVKALSVKCLDEEQ